MGARTGTLTATVLLSATLLVSPGPASWSQELPGPTTVYDAGAWHPAVSSWTGEGTRSELTPDGLLISDTSTQNGSGRAYSLPWGIDAAAGGALEARVKAISCSASWGVCMMVADGVHEEALTIFPDHLLLINCKKTVPFDASGDFHTYRLEFKGQDLRLLVDGEVLIDAAGEFTSPAIGDKPRNTCTFGSGASTAQGESVWQWVRAYGMDPARRVEQEISLPEVAGLHVEIGKTQVILPGKTYQSLFKFRDGRLAVANMHSSDAGQTWQPGEGAFGTGDFEFTDGEIIKPGFLSDKVADGVFSVSLVRQAAGSTASAGEKATLNIPEGTGGTGDDGKAYTGPAVDHAVVQCRDGSLLAAMYGYFKTDTVLCPTFPPEWKLYKYRTFVVRSTDRGRTWDYWATVAYDPEVGLESFCEADLLSMPDGSILCFMRTGGSSGQYTPLYLSKSTDDGKTWSKPKPIADRGVWPNACRMADGTLVVTYGRPDNWLAFSLDDGETWTGHFCFHKGSSTSYNTVEEVAPGRLLVVYDRQGLAPDGNPLSGVVGTFVEVRRD